MYLLPSRRAFTTYLALCLNAIFLSSCGDGVVISENQSGSDPIEQQLRQRIQFTTVTGDLEGDRTLPAITDPVAELGKNLFFHHWAWWRS
ncbi:hypothetical protein N9850_13270 [Granulosicoccus sp.]|nr:hypothetical protein [Granulosicoccus sp.]MDB4224736.1 hypothetical protein [Granulosicoccus sp.]